MGELGRSTVEVDLRVAGLEALVEEQLRLSRRLYRLTGELDAFTPRVHIGDGCFEIEYDVKEAIWRGIHTLEALHARNRYLRMSYEKELGLSEPFPIYPFKAHPSRYGFTLQNDKGNYLFKNFHSAYAAKHCLDVVLKDKTFKWVNRRLIITDDGVSIKGENITDLEEIMDYKFKGKEAQWIVPEPYLSYFSRIASVELPSPRLSSEPSARAPKVEREKVDRPDGLISLADLAEDLDIDPREARQILRKHSEKPAWGWAWSRDAIDAIKKIISKNRS